MTYYPPVKPAGLFKLPAGEYLTIDVNPIVPKADGMLHYLAYLNVSYDLNTQAKAAELRVRLRRMPWKGQPADDTDYQTHWLIPGYSSYLLTQTYFEWAEENRPVVVQARIKGGSAVLGTRYFKAGT